MSYAEQLQEYVTLINEALADMFSNEVVEPLRSSMEYSLMAGGKRLRPVLCLAANGLKNGNRSEALPIACAVEMIHTYSLIHDDLPAMDNDCLRRGKPTNHILFGEATAILAGDGLLTHAMETMLQNAQAHPDNLPAHVAAMADVIHGAGIYGMVAGQALDLDAEGRKVEEEEVYAIHSRKTSALIEAPLKAGLRLCAPTEQELEAVQTFGKNLGLCFQIVDDILDVVGDEKKLGKSVGKDAKADKQTFPKLYGLEGSRKLAEECVEKAIAAVSDVFGDRAEFLCELALSQKNREK